MGRDQQGARLSAHPGPWHSEPAWNREQDGHRRADTCPETGCAVPSGSPGPGPPQEGEGHRGDRGQPALPRGSGPLITNRASCVGDACWDHGQQHKELRGSPQANGRASKDLPGRRTAPTSPAPGTRFCPPVKLPSNNPCFDIKGRSRRVCKPSWASAEDLPASHPVSPDSSLKAQPHTGRTRTGNLETLLMTAAHL